MTPQRDTPDQRTAHTPAPWPIEADHVRIGKLNVGSLNGFYPLGKADLRVISAAPYAIAALRRVRAFVEVEVENRGAAGSDMSDYQSEAQDALDRIDTVLAAVDGHSPSPAREAGR